MKTEWKFFWDAYDFHFSKTHRFLGTFQIHDDGPATPLVDLEAEIVVEPATKVRAGSGAQQSGELTVTLPFPPEGAKPYAYEVAMQVREQFAFTNGDFRVHFGFVSCRRIAEDAEEEALIDGKPYLVTLHLEEVLPPPSFDGSALPSIGGGNVPLELLAQFNSTRRDDEPTRKFLGYFRILESLSHRGGSPKPLKQALREFERLRTQFKLIVPGADYDEFVAQLVEARHRCAHLKLDREFGYTPVDPAVRSVVLPLLGPLEALTYECLRQ